MQKAPLSKVCASSVELLLTRALHIGVSAERALSGANRIRGESVAHRCYFLQLGNSIHSRYREFLRGGFYSITIARENVEQSGTIVSTVSFAQARPCAFFYGICKLRNSFAYRIRTF